MNENNKESGIFKNDNTEIIYKTGDIIEGTVDNITKFGAFVALPNGKKGLVHISEISCKYVKNVSDYVTLKQKVKVKVLNDDNNKIVLSMSKAESSPEKQTNTLNFKKNFSSKNKNLESMIHKYKKISEEKNFVFKFKN